MWLPCRFITNAAYLPLAGFPLVHCCCRDTVCRQRLFCTKVLYSMVRFVYACNFSSHQLTLVRALLVTYLQCAKLLYKLQELLFDDYFLCFSNLVQLLRHTAAASCYFKDFQGGQKASKRTGILCGHPFPYQLNSMVCLLCAYSSPAAGYGVTSTMSFADCVYSWCPDVGSALAYAEG